MKEKILKALALWFRGYGQKKNNVTVTRVQCLARKIMRSQKYCFLNTIDEGAIFSRVLQPFPPDEEFTVWLGTSPHSRKAKQIRKNPNGVLSYLDPKKGGAVSLDGKFEIVTDIAMRRRYFNPVWWAFFPEGPEGSDFVSLRFTADKIEVWDGGRGIAPEPFGLKSAVIQRQNQQWSLKEDPAAA